MRINLMAAGVGTLAMAFGGCSRSLVPETLDDVIGARTSESEQEFWHRLPGRPAVTNSEGLHGVLLLADGTDPTANWDERVALFRERGWIQEGFDQPGNQTLDRGTLAKALCHAMDVEGGVMMRVTDKHPRYAIRELAYLRVMASSTENQVVSGLDYLGIISKAQDYMMLRDQKRARQTIPDIAPGAEGEPAPTGADGGEPSL